MRIVLLLAVFLSLNAHANEYTSPYGEWRGQTEYQAFLKATPDPDSHAVINLTINVEPGGKVVGTSTENGCRLLGLSAPGITPTILTLNVTLSGCKYTAYNRTYRGHISVFSKERYAKFTLQALDVAPGKGHTYNINSTMRR